MGKSRKDKQQQQQSAGETSIGQTDDLISAIPQDKSTSSAVTAVLNSRFARDEIYTRIGQSIIVAVNPCKPVEICSDDHVKSIGNAVKDGKDRPAHLFELAANSYFSLIKDARNQGILFLGETGSGKSQSFNLTIKELVAISKSKKKERKTSTRLLKSLSVLEAFGHAKTLNNDNASRYGKYIELQFNGRHKLTGARISDYLLEKHRVSKVPFGERTFHAFYYMLAGASAEERELWMLDDVKHYRVLAESKQYKAQSIDDVSKYTELKSALKACGFKEKYQRQIFRLLSCILHLGNLEFVQPESKDDAAIIENQELLEDVADMLGVRPFNLVNALVYKTKLIKKELCTMFLDPFEAAEQRDNFCQTLYNLLWVWIVDMLNKRLEDQQESQQQLNYIALIDLCGLENHKDNYFHQLLYNYTSERLQALANEMIFDNQINEYRSENITIDEVSYGDNSGIISLLYGRPDSVLNVFDEESSKVKKRAKVSQIIERLNDAHRENEFFIEFKKSKSMFGIRHINADVHYDVSEFLEINSEQISPDFITLFRGGPDVRPSKNEFLANLFAQKSIDVDRAADHEAAVVNALQVNAPKRQPTQRKGAEGKKKDSRDAGGPSTFFSDYHRALEDLVQSVQDLQLSYVYCIRSNAERRPNDFDAKLVEDQVRTFSLEDVVRLKQLGYGRSYELEEFVKKYQLTAWESLKEGGGGSARDKIAVIMNELGMGSRDYAYGARRLYLTELAVRQMDRVLRKAEKAERKRIKEKIARGEADSEFLQQQQDQMYGNDEQSDIGESDLEQSSRITGDSDSETQAETDNEDDRRSTVSYGSEFSVYADDKQKFEETQKNFELQVEEEEQPISAVRRNWLRTTTFLTWWIPTRCLEWNGMKRSDIQQAWREKVALCMLILLLSALMLFFITGFSIILCPTDRMYNSVELAGFTSAASGGLYVAVHGNVYDYTSARNTHTTGPEFVDQYGGKDATIEFPLTPDLCGKETDPTIDWTVGSSYPHQQATALAILNPKNKKIWKGYYTFTRNQLKKDYAKPNQWYIIVDKKVYNFTLYRNANLKYLPDSASALILQFGGMDATDGFNKMSSADKKAALSCMNIMHFAGVIDTRDSPQCIFADTILLVATGILVAIMVVKFLSALQLNSKGEPEEYDRFVIIQVPCYTEGEENLKRTLESLATLRYDDKRKLMFIIADGNIIGSGNDRATWRIALDILGVDPSIDPPKLSFQSLGEGNRQHNMGKVYTGLYDIQGHLVPYVVVVKVGKDNETRRPGNRGKRDSQMILMRFLQKVHYDDPMSPLELELFHQIKNVIGVDPSFYEFALMVDADTEVYPDSLNRLVSAMVHDAKIVGICGETTIANERDSWITMMQVYEYYISHHLAKAFESLFGSVTCLPGCFCMYRIRTPSKSIPLLTSKSVIADYSVNDVDTLHKKNLLSLGEDRYLTTLMLKHFPNMKITFTADAQCKTYVPDRWGVLLSQRRRWINSTVHNLAELLLLPQLCGFCCFSMRFVVFFDLFATLVMPATMGYLVYLIYTAFSGRFFPLVSIILLVAGYGLQVVIFLLKRKWEHIGWLVIYILALPFFTLILPLYAFWHFDDFSWGNTRIVVGEKGGKKQIVDEEPFDPNSIPMKRWSEYESEMWERDSQMSGTSSHYTESVRPPSMAPGASSMYGAGSAAAYMPQQPMYAPMDPQSRPVSMMIPTQQSPKQRPMSFGGPPPNVNGEPSNDQITAQIKSILATANLMTVTKKQVRDELSMFFGVDMSSRKDFINKVIEDVLQGRL